MKLYGKELSFSENGKRLTMLSLALPKLFQEVFQKLLGTVNSAMLSNYSDAAVEAVSVSNDVLLVVTTLLDALAFGASILVSLSLGRKDRKTAGWITSVTLFSSLAVSLLVGCILTVTAEPILRMMNAEAETLMLSVSYFRIKALTLPITVIGATLTSLLICNGHALFSFLIGVGRSILNIGGTYLVLYGGLGIPAVEGIAYASASVLLLGIFADVAVFTLKRCPFVFSFRRHVLWDVLRYGVPGKMSTFSYRFAHMVTTSFIVAIGGGIVSTKVYIGNITGYVSLFSSAIAAGGAILVGRFLGAKRMESVEGLYRKNLVLATLLSLITAVLAFVFCRPLMGIFTDRAEAILLSRKVFFVDIFVQLFRAVNMVSDQSLNACGHVKTTLTASAVSCWACSVGLAYVFGVLLGWGLVGIWVSFALDELFRAVFYLIYWKKRIRAQLTSFKAQAT